MMFEKIKSLAPPPLSPLHNGSGISWKEIQKKNGVRLPGCLDEFARCYGSGYFDGDASKFYVCNPYDPCYQKTIKQMVDVYSSLREDSPEYYPYNWFPEPEGMYPIAYGDGATHFYIIMDANDPEDYLLVYEWRSNFTELPGLTVFDGIYDFLSNRLEPSPCFPSSIVFQPESHHS